MEINNFIEQMKLLNLTLTDEQLNQLDKYYELLIEWNKKINLTSIIEKNQVYLKHFYDSSTIVKIIDLSQYNNLCDIGTGAGFPGLVLKILYPNLKITLVDSLQKRCIFLKNVIEKLNLKDIEVFHDRAEDFAKKHREEFDIVTSRAVANLSILLEYSIPMVKINGYMIALKGNLTDEILNSETIMKKLDTKLDKKIQFLLPIENSSRSLISFKKLKLTNKKYPRKYSEIKNSKKCL